MLTALLTARVFCRPLLLALSLFGCTSTIELSARRQFAAYPTFGAEPVRFDGSLSRYVGHAASHNPHLRATHEQWAAALHGIDQTKRLPEPMLSYTVFVRRIETRVGPQRHRAGFTQRFPWPTQITEATRSASLMAQANGRALEAQALTITRQVASAYWDLWLVERERSVLTQQGELLSTIASAAETRIEIGKATLADLTHTHLMMARLDDQVAALEERRQQLAAGMRADLDLSGDVALPIATTSPDIALPVVDEELERAVLDNPRGEELTLAAEARRHAADSAFAEGLPGFSIGADYIEIGDAVMPSPDSGRDAVSISAAVNIPIWRHAYDGKQQRLLAEGRALDARRVALERDALASLEQTVSALRDSFRRVKLYRTTLIPQAETVYESALGGYLTGEGGFSDTLLAQRSLLDLQLLLFRTEAEHAKTWARLEELAGRNVATKGTP